VNSTVKSIMVWACIIAFGMVLISWVSKGTGMGKDTEISYSDLYNLVKTQQVLDAEIQGTELHGHLKAKPKEQFHTHVGEHCEAIEAALLASGTHFSKKEQQSNFPLQLLINLGPFVLLIGIWFFFMRQMQSGGNKAMSFGKSKARLLSMQQKKITF